MTVQVVLVLSVLTCVTASRAAAWIGAPAPVMKRIPGTPFAADFWAAQDGLRYYFLSHLHADHTAGLSGAPHGSRNGWWTRLTTRSDTWRCGTIYCSPITKELLHLKWPGETPHSDSHARAALTRAQNFT